jgi:hypothetical protein
MMKTVLLLVGTAGGRATFVLPSQRMLSNAEGRRLFEAYKTQGERLKDLGASQDGLIYVMYMPKEEYDALMKRRASFEEIRDAAEVVGSTPYYGRSDFLKNKMETMRSVIAEL